VRTNIELDEDLVDEAFKYATGRPQKDVVHLVLATLAVLRDRDAPVCITSFIALELLQSVPDQQATRRLETYLGARPLPTCATESNRTTRPCDAHHERASSERAGSPQLRGETRSSDTHVDVLDRASR
jgi:hypothetical protein